MKNKPHNTVIGRNDIIDLPELGLFNLGAKVDTGAYTSALHYKKWKLEDGVLHITFELEKGTEKNIACKDFYQKVIRNSFGQAEKRYIIKTPVLIFGEEIMTEFSLSNRKSMRFPVLLGRKFLKGKFMVDVNRYQISFKKKEKNKQ